MKPRKCLTELLVITWLLPFPPLQILAMVILSRRTFRRQYDTIDSGRWDAITSRRP